MTRCNTVWRETPRIRVASCIGTYPRRRLCDEAGEKLWGDPDLPWCSGRDLFAGDESIVDPPVQRRGRHIQALGRFLDAHQVTVGRAGRWIETPEFPVAAQGADMYRCEGVAVGGRLALAAQDAGDHAIRIVMGQPAYELEGVFVGSDRGPTPLGAFDIELGERPAAPAQCQVSSLSARAAR